MTIFVSLFAATATIATAGFGVTMLLVRQRLTIWENCALAWLFGTTAISLSLWIGGFLLHGIALQLAVTGACVVLGAPGFSAMANCLRRKEDCFGKSGDCFHHAFQFGTRPRCRSYYWRRKSRVKID